MIINPYRDRPAVLPGTRAIAETLGVVGREVVDPNEPARPWTVHGLFAPLPGRAVGGLRAKAVDQKGFVSFCNQRDLEVMLDLARPGDRCVWAGCDYVAPRSRAWCGLCCDADDLQDEAHEYELLLRAMAPGGPIGATERTRRVHVGPGEDVEETVLFLGDFDPETGLGPDPRLETIGWRWVTAERRRVLWQSI